MQDYITKSREAIQRLAEDRTPPPRTVVERCYSEISEARAAGVGWAEIAEALGQREPSIRIAFYRHRRRLREGTVTPAQPARARASTSRQAAPPAPPPATPTPSPPGPGGQAEESDGGMQEKVLPNGKKIKIPAPKKYDFSRPGVITIGNTSAENVDILSREKSKDE